MKITHKEILLTKHYVFGMVKISKKIKAASLKIFIITNGLMD
jgi:hypothetical protein